MVTWPTATIVSYHGYLVAHNKSELHPCYHGYLVRVSPISVLLVKLTPQYKNCPPAPSHFRRAVMEVCLRTLVQTPERGCKVGAGARDWGRGIYI